MSRGFLRVRAVREGHEREIGPLICDGRVFSVGDPEPALDLGASGWKW